MSELQLWPFGQAQASMPDATTLIGTFALAERMAGWVMTEVSLDESGFFMTVQWKYVGLPDMESDAETDEEEDPDD